MLVSRQPLSLLQTLSSDELIDMTSAATIVTVDTEGLKKMLGFSICFDGLSDGFYLPFNHAKDNLTEAQQKKIYSVLDSREALVFHNAVHDLRVLARNGFDYRGKFYDTMLMAHWINEERMSYALDKISQVYGGKPKTMPESMSMIIEQEGWDSVPLELMIQYSGNDAFIEHELFRKLLPEFQKQGFDGDLWATEQRFIRDVMGPMMDLGVKLDLEFTVKKILTGNSIMESCKQKLGYRTIGSNALTEILINKLQLPIVKTTPTGRPCFDKEAMAEYDALLERKQDPTAQTILRYRGWQKTVSANYKAYMEYVDDNGVLHPGYKLHGTKTGRLSCEKPALQQIPKSSDKEWNGDLKRAFVARSGFSLWTVDYSQLQFRMTCSYANQQDLIEIFNDSDRDIFTEMANQMGWARSDVKTLVYLILFGGGAKRARDAFNLPSIEEGGALVDEFHSLYPNIKKVSNQAKREAQAQGFVKYWTGRRRHFPKGSAYYQAFNACIQGGEAEIIKRAMILLQDKVCNEDCRMVLQIHDELAFEIADGKESLYLPRIQSIMEQVPNEQFCAFTGNYVSFTTSAGEWGKK